ncbi:hypothetical protein [Lysobacter gummosus]
MKETSAVPACGGAHLFNRIAAARADPVRARLWSNPPCLPR